jgi:VIT1/CCC1 family predicted Fe2+/Mn2+ transporter
MHRQSEAAQYLENWRNEIDSAFLYHTLANLETQPNLAEVYRKLSATEESHAQFWEQKLLDAGQSLPRRRVGWRTRMLALLAKWLGPQFVLPTINTLEQVDSHRYDAQIDAQNTLLPIQERSHARLLQSIASPKAGLEGNALAQLEGRHRTIGGNTLRAAVLGVNDGLLSNLSLVMGVAGASLAEHTILITGLSGLLAGACSMAIGEWISVQSARELFDRQIRIEQREVEEVPDEEEEELALIYEAKGLSTEQAKRLAAQIMSDQATALDTLSREELGIDPEEMGGSPWTAAATSFIVFTLGAIVPVIPFMLLQGMAAVSLSWVLSGLALFLIGAGITLLTGQNVFYSGFRQVIFGFAAAGITYGIGKLIGVSVGG